MQVSARRSWTLIMVDLAGIRFLLLGSVLQLPIETPEQATRCSALTAALLGS
jgi:hypothetical protein